MHAAAIMVTGPTAGNSVSITSTSTTAQNLGTSTTKIAMKATVKTHIIFGESNVSAAQTTDYYLTADVDYVFDVTPGTQYFRAIRSSSDGTLIWAKVG